MHVICSKGRRQGTRPAQLAAGVAVAALALSACAASAGTSGRGVPARAGCACRGAVISVVPVASFSATRLAAALKSIGLPSTEMVR